MTVIRGSADCGNSPRNRFVQDVAGALASGRFPQEALGENAVWCGPAGQRIEGRSAIEEWLAQQDSPAEVQIIHAISHGKVGAANGLVIDATGPGRRFSFVLEFTSTKGNIVSRVESYA